VQVKIFFYPGEMLTAILKLWLNHLDDIVNCKTNNLADSFVNNGMFSEEINGDLRRIQLSHSKSLIDKSTMFIILFSILDHIPYTTYSHEWSTINMKIDNEHLDAVITFIVDGSSTLKITNNIERQLHKIALDDNGKELIDMLTSLHWNLTEVDKLLISHMLLLQKQLFTFGPSNTRLEKVYEILHRTGDEKCK
jgi:hypothetical protein